MRLQVGRPLWTLEAVPGVVSRVSEHQEEGIYCDIGKEGVAQRKC